MLITFRDCRFCYKTFVRGFGAGMARPGPGPFYFFMDPDSDPNPKGPKFSDPYLDSSRSDGFMVLNESTTKSL